MRIAFDHGGFQRAAIAVMAFGVAGALAAAVAGANTTLAAVVTLGATALPLGLGALRAAREGRLVASTVSSAAALGGAWLVCWTLAVGTGAAADEAPAPLAAASLGLLAGLVASLGLVGRCLRITRDVVGDAIDAACPDLDAANLALCGRAAAAAAKISSAAATRAMGGAEARRSAAEVEAVARRVAL